MKNYAIIQDGVVVNIVIGDEEWANSQADTAVEYTEANPAYIGGDYVDGVFYPPKPFPSWTRGDGFWVAPIEKPDSTDDAYAYVWSEETLSWKYIEIPDPKKRQTKYVPLIDEFID